MGSHVTSFRTWEHGNIEMLQHTEHTDVLIYLNITMEEFMYLTGCSPYLDSSLLYSDYQNLLELICWKTTPQCYILSIMYLTYITYPKDSAHVC